MHIKSNTNAHDKLLWVRFGGKNSCEVEILDAGHKVDKSAILDFGAKITNLIVNVNFMF